MWQLAESLHPFMVDTGCLAPWEETECSNFDLLEVLGENEARGAVRNSLFP